MEQGDFTAACVQESARFYYCLLLLLLLREVVGCFLGILHADTAVAVKARRAAAANVANVRRPAVDALDTRKTGPAGACH